MSTVIQVANLSKIYRLGEIGTGTISRDLERWYKMRIRGQEDPFLKIGENNERSKKGESDVVYSLRDINFKVQQGDALGIIGKNGAGKSTLLKIISRITSPTIGKINIKGRIASLLEVGTGFHPELTGRENIYLNGAILGMHNKEITQKLDEIIDFSGVERYIETPVKRYSSGMYVRLAFAVAAHLESEIFIVDEVLAVGDADFQKKCLGKMQDVSTKEGRTVLFVSHNMSTIRHLCNKGILLNNGLIEYYGSANDTVNEYGEKLLRKSEASWINKEKENHSARLEKIEIKDKQGQLKKDFSTNEEIFISLHLHSLQTIKNVKVGFDLMKNGEVAFRTQQVDYIKSSTLEENSYYEMICKIPNYFLNIGEYHIRPLFSIHCAEVLTSVYDVVLGFNILLDPTRSEFHTLLNESNHPGILFPILEWKTYEKVI